MRQRLKRNSRGSIVLPNGETITKKEQQLLKNEVAKSNRKRKKLLEDLPEKAKHKYNDFGVESDWVMRKKSTSFSRFRNKKEFKTYLNQLKRVNNNKYINKLINTYKNNYKKAVRQVFNSNGDDIVDFIDSLSNEEFRQLTLNEDIEDIGYVYYEPISAKNKLSKMQRQVDKLKNKSNKLRNITKSAKVYV